MKGLKRKILGKSGISSLELAVVLALIAIMATFTIPYLGSWLKHYRVVGASREVTSKIQEARLKAVADNVEWRIVIDQDNDTYWLEQGDSISGTNNWTIQGGTRSLPKGVIFVNESGWGDATGRIYLKFKPSGVVAYNTDGSSNYNESDESLFIKGETSDVFKVEILSLTGRVAIYAWNGIGWIPT